MSRLNTFSLALLAACLFATASLDAQRSRSMQGRSTTTVHEHGASLANYDANIKLVADFTGGGVPDDLGFFMVRESDRSDSAVPGKGTSVTIEKGHHLVIDTKGKAVDFRFPLSFVKDGQIQDACYIQVKAEEKKVPSLVQIPKTELIRNGESILQNGRP